MNRNRRLIIALFEASQAENIRALQTALDLYQYLWGLPSRDNLERNPQVWSSILALVMGITCEIKKNAENLQGLQMLFEEDSMPLRIFYNKEKDDQSKELAFMRTFEQTYFTSHAVRMPSLRSVLIFATQGLLIQDQFTYELQQENERQSKNQKNPESLFFGEYWRLTDEQFSETGDRLIGKLMQGEEKSTTGLVRLAQRLFYFASVGLLTKTPFDLKQCFLEIISRLEKDETLEFGDLEQNSHIFSNNIDEKNYIEIFAYLVESDKKIGQKRLKNSLVEIFRNLSQSTEKAIGEFYERHPELERRPALVLLDPKMFVDAIVLMSPSAVIEFRNFLENRYKDNNIRDYLGEEYSFVNDLLVGLNSQPKATQRPLTMHAKEVLRHTLDKIRVKLAPSTGNE